MLQAFVFNNIAVTVRHWYEVGANDEEHGARLEVRALVKHPHRGSESATQIQELDRVVCRFDLFDVIGEAPGNFARAHFHPNFDATGTEPSDRNWDADLSQDPFGWTAARLTDLSGLIEQSGAELDWSDDDAQELRDSVPEIIEAAKRFAASACTSPARCRELTRDTAQAVGMMMTDIRGVSSDPPAADPRLADDAPLKWAGGLTTSS
jgi:hypothetical protein